MNHRTINSNAVNPSDSGLLLPHCQHRLRRGRYCRLPIQDTDSSLCFRHAALRNEHPDSADLSAELTAGLADFKSAEAVNQFLSRLLILQAQGRIAPRRAAVMIFNCNQLLHSLGIIVREKAVEPTQIVFDIPCAVARREQLQP